MLLQGNSPSLAGGFTCFTGLLLLDVRKTTQSPKRCSAPLASPGLHDHLQSKVGVHLPSSKSRVKTRRLSGLSPEPLKNQSQCSGVLCELRRPKPGRRTKLAHGHYRFLYSPKKASALHPRERKTSSWESIPAFSEKKRTATCHPREPLPACTAHAHRWPFVNRRISLANGRNPT